jgi:hypothetical protein
MKTLYAIALIALLSAVGHAQNRTMADATHAIKGPVKTFRTEVATFVSKDGEYVEGPRELREEAWFNTDGNRTDYHLYSKGVLSRRIVMKYEGRRMLECINYNGAGQAYLRIVNTYDETGKKTEENTFHGDGSLRSTTTYKRNPRGQILEIVERSAQGILMEQMYYKYEGKEVYTWERKIYDPSGTLKQDEIYVAPNKKTFINYNSDGSVASRIVRVGQEMAHYAADGSILKATVIAEEDRLLDEMTIKKDGSATRQTQLPDEVDQHGNWTKQTKWFANPNGTRPLTVTYRALTYY